MSIIKQSEELGSKARAERRFFQGIVVHVDSIRHVAKVDVDATLPDGTTVYLEDVPFSPQTPPQIGDNVCIEYGSSSVHSARIVSGRLGSINSQDNIKVVGGVSTLKKRSSGGVDGTSMKGDLALVEGSNITLTEDTTNKRITISASGVSLSNDNPYDVADSPNAGTSSDVSRKDHVHKGVTSVKKRSSGGVDGTALYGDVALVEGSNITLSEDVANKRITIAGETPSGIPGAIPYWRARGYISGVNALLDSSYFRVNGIAGANFPSGSPTQVAYTQYCTGPGGTLIVPMTNCLWQVWFRLGIRATSNSFYNMFLARFDDIIGIYNELPEENSGTVTVTASTKAVVGVSTAFNTDAAAGDMLLITSGSKAGEMLRISSITDNTHMTLVNAPTGDISTGVHYKIVKKLYTGTAYTSPAYSDSPSVHSGDNVLHVFWSCHSDPGEFCLILDAFEVSNYTWYDVGV